MTIDGTLITEAIYGFIGLGIGVSGTLKFLGGRNKHREEWDGKDRRENPVYMEDSRCKEYRESMQLSVKDLEDEQKESFNKLETKLETFRQENREDRRLIFEKLEKMLELIHSKTLPPQPGEMRNV